MKLLASKIFLLTFLLGTSLICMAQLDHIPINCDLIRFHKIEKMLAKNKVSNNIDLQKLGAACYDSSSSKGFSFHTLTYEVPISIDTLWKTYKTINPAEAWKGEFVDFGFRYSRQSGEIAYHNEVYNGAEEGQVMFITLKILGGLIKVAVGHEITHIDEPNKIMKICYLQPGKSHGSQYIRLEAKENGNTIIHHDTWYKSDSKFRDANLYPLLHTTIINDFHRRVIEKTTQSSTEIYP